MEQTLTNDVAEGIPPQEDLWTNAPGELVWRYVADAKMEASGMAGFSWQVKKLTSGVHFPAEPGLAVVRYEASAPYRACVYQGDTAEEALACLLKGYCHLSRDGSINPSNPHSTGAPIIQHAMHILTERLLWSVENRQNHLVMGGYADHPGAVGPSPYANKKFSDEGQDDSKSQQEREDNFTNQMMHAVSRDNEIVAALGTAIAALARVKDL